ncbi:hypothetical protein [Ensifer soli]|uniref:hypothetical protein n=1 Tax=Ciceribacter sp. sgz301302 TaxID=3342379 RepID=UPI0035B97A25
MGTVTGVSPAGLLKVFTGLGLVALLASGCTTPRAAEPGDRPGIGSAEQYRQHRLQQQRRFEEGGYTRLYRPRTCRPPGCPTPPR